MAESEEYGSIMEGSETLLENRDFEESSSHDFEDTRTTECSCRSHCTRRLTTSKNGKITGCPCKGLGLKCGTRCSCGSKEKPCRNKLPSAMPTGDQLQAQTGQPNTRSEADVNVNELLESLDYETLLKIAKQGFQSRGLLLKDLVNAAGNPEEPQPSGAVTVPPFCICGYCREMPSDKENFCCKERRLCRSRTVTFNNICVDSDNITTVIRSLADTYVFTPTYDNRAMRHAAYRQYIMWQHGHLGRGHRKVIPSCCVWEIRKHYPSPNGQYTGYKDH